MRAAGTDQEELARQFEHSHCLGLPVLDAEGLLVGVVIPLGLKLLRVDPALASSIFLTTVTDVAGFFFFLGLATLALRLVA